MEIYLDWASDIGRDPATDTALGVDPISTSLLVSTISIAIKTCRRSRAANPRFTRKRRKRAGCRLVSAKHHVLTIEYCFDVTHKALMEIVRQWASQSSLDQNVVAKIFTDKTVDRLQARLDSEVVRLNAYMSFGHERRSSESASSTDCRFLVQRAGRARGHRPKVRPVRTAVQ